MVEHGADLNVTESLQKTTPLHWAAENGNVLGCIFHWVEELRSCSSFSHLLFAGNEDIVKFFVDKGLDVHAKDDFGSIPLFLAVAHGNSLSLQK